MGTKNDPGKYDCHAAARDDEPLFTLLGRDRHAPTLVRLWALLRMREGEDQEKVDEAIRCADAMDAYRGGPYEGLSSDFEARLELLLEAATDGMDEHPEDYHWPCLCDECRSYA